MFLPAYIRTCICMLEEAGFAAYAVGGCVRDALLGLEPHDYDLCTHARPDEIRRVFAGFRLILAGEKHGTVTVLVSREEFYAQQSREYVEAAFDGSLPAFVAAFSRSRKLKPEEIASLQRLIDESRR